MHFGTKSYLKSNRNHTAKQTFRREKKQIIFLTLKNNLKSHRRHIILLILMNLAFNHHFH
jgi:hypothetical protein